MNSLLGNAAAPSFDDPLEMLRACHGRIEAQCATLSKLSGHLATHGSDTSASQAARAILRYFDTAGQHHHQDEECDLFPMLLAMRHEEITSLITRLLSEHKDMDAAWQALRPMLVEVEAGRSLTWDAEIASHFISLYAKHIELENGRFLPLAATLLDVAQRRMLGHKMAIRRGVSI
ncbi:MAG: hemerythrin domain-containing protein [Sideroxydans sp.]|jgi:hemerythrin-like domain-containing protein